METVVLGIPIRWAITVTPTPFSRSDTVSIFLIQLHYLVFLRYDQMKLGIRGKALDWLSNYLFERTQFVDFDGTYSKNATICYGVPQGSILGPLF